MRVVVTGVTAQGRAAFASDRLLEPVTVAAVPNAEFYRVWGADEPVEVPSDGRHPNAVDLFPPARGFRFVVLRLGPDSEAQMPADLDIAKAMAEMEEKLPGAAARMEPDNPGMHQTDTIDYVVVLSGDIWLELDDGSERLLHAGDLVIQNGTRHAWRNKSSAWCTLAAALVGSPRKN
jgi:mannose-6-phosphate isomerase-like protein (cupin superfamily)